MQSKFLLCVELVLTHEHARERVGNTYHRGNTYPREGEQISLLVHQGEHISPRAWLEISVRGNRKSGGTHISVTPPLPRLHNGIPPDGADYGSVRGVLLNIFSNQHTRVLARRSRRFCLLLLWSKSVRQPIQSDLRDVEALEAVTIAPSLRSDAI